MVLPEYIGFLCAFVGICVGPFVAYNFINNVWGVLLGLIIGSFVGWLVGIGISHIIVFASTRRSDKKQG